MKRFSSAFTVLLFAVILLIPSPALAGSAELNLSADFEHAEAGDTVSVHVVFSSRQALDAVSAAIIYDSSRLKYISGGGNDAQISGGTGVLYATGGEFTDSFEYTFTFLAYKEGTAYFRLRDCEAISYVSKKNILGSTTERVVIVVGKSSGEPDEPMPSFSPPSDISGQPSSAVPSAGNDVNDNATITLSGVEYIVDTGDSLSGLMKSSVCVVDGVSYPSWQGSSEYILLSMEGRRLLYDTVSQKNLPLLLFSQETVLVPASPQSPPALKSVTLTINGCETKAYITDDEDFFLVYCTGVSGNAWYYYDSTECTFQRAHGIERNSALFTPLSEHTDGSGTGSPGFLLYAVIAAAVIASVLAVLLIISAVKGR